MSNDAHTLAYRIEAALFSEGGTVSKKRIAQLLSISGADVARGLRELSEIRKEGGLALVETPGEAALVLNEDASRALKESYERELSREIGDAGLEVLALVLYLGPSTRARIDYVRGVNTSSTIRTLASRGLLERIPNPEDSREYLYRPTPDLLAHLGVRRSEELPDYATISGELAAFEPNHDVFHDGTGTESKHAESTG